MIEDEKRGRSTGSLGTTKRGVGPAYASKMNRNGLRFCDLVGPDDVLVERLGALPSLPARALPGLRAADALEADDEARQAAAVPRPPRREERRAGHRDAPPGPHRGEPDDPGGGRQRRAARRGLRHLPLRHVVVDDRRRRLHAGLRVPPSQVDCVIGVVKAYDARRRGPFPTELGLGEGAGRHLSSVGHEYGHDDGAEAAVRLARRAAAAVLARRQRLRQHQPDEARRADGPRR